MGAQASTAALGSRPASVTIRSLLPTLAPAERRVADVVLAAPAEVAALSIGALAERCDTSEATVVRFCQRVGFRGYPDLRLALASEAGRSAAQGRRTDAGIEVSPDDSLAEIVEKVGQADTRAIADTVAHLDLSELERAVQAIGDARATEIYGIGASGLVAIDLEQKLRRIRLPAAAATDRHAALTSAALRGAGDVVLAISHSGETSDVVAPLVRAGDAGATTIALTNHLGSALARAADVVLATAARESTFRSGATASRVAQLTVVDCLFIAVAQRQYDRTVDALDRTLAAVQDARSGRGGRDA